MSLRRYFFVSCHSCHPDTEPVIGLIVRYALLFCLYEYIRGVLVKLNPGLPW